MTNSNGVTHSQVCFNLVDVPEFVRGKLICSTRYVNSISMGGPALVLGLVCGDLIAVSLGPEISILAR